MKQSCEGQIMILKDTSEYFDVKSLFVKLMKELLLLVDELLCLLKTFFFRILFVHETHFSCICCVWLFEFVIFHTKGSGCKGLLQYRSSSCL